jgi:hypothetical protein
VLVLALKLLGGWRRAPLAPIITVLLVKFSAIGLGLVNAVVLRRTAAWHARTIRNLSHSEARRLALMGGMSLVSWLTAVGAGRIIGYW